MKPMLFGLILLCFATLLTACESSKSSVPNDERNGDQIIAALEKYKTERGSYPDVLSQLEPTYISRIVPPRYGQGRWDYIHYCKNDSFGLAMWGRRVTDDGYVYSSERKQWEIAKNSF